jgi:hypothetical protein
MPAGRKLLFITEQLQAASTGAPLDARYFGLSELKSRLQIDF